MLPSRDAYSPISLNVFCSFAAVAMETVFMFAAESYQCCVL